MLSDVERSDRSSQRTSRRSRTSRCGPSTRRRLTSTRSTGAACGSSARARWWDTFARRRTPASCRLATSGSSRRRRCTPSRRSLLLRMPSPTARSRPCRTGSATRRSSRRTVGRVIRGTTFPAGKILEPGVVQWDVKGDTTIGPFEAAPAESAEIERLADACTRGGMPTAAVADARGPQWRKVIFNAATNPIGALTGLTHGRVCEQPAAARARLAPRRRGQGRCGRPGNRARLGPRGADRLRRPPRGRVRPQGVDAPGRGGAQAD